MHVVREEVERMNVSDWGLYAINSVNDHNVNINLEMCFYQFNCFKFPLTVGGNIGVNTAKCSTTFTSVSLTLSVCCLGLSRWYATENNDDADDSSVSEPSHYSCGPEYRKIS